VEVGIDGIGRQSRVRGVRSGAEGRDRSPEPGPQPAWKMQVASIRLDHVTKRFDGRRPAVDDVSLDVADGLRAGRTHHAIAWTGIHACA
jgi:hypothetical protein